MNKKTLLSTIMVAMSSLVMAQANFWNLNGTYIDCITGAIGTLSSTSMPHHLYESDASSFAIPGLCETYCNLSYGSPGPGAGNTIVLNHITEGYSPSIPGFLFGKKTILTGVSALDASYAASQLQSDGTRTIYARAGNVIYRVCSVMPDGSTSGSPTVIYTPPAPFGYEFDFWTKMEVSADGKFLLLVGKDAKSLMALNLETYATFVYNAPGGVHGRIQGFEYVKLSTTVPIRIYISYNSKNAANPSGTGGVGFYTLMDPSTFYNVAPPSGISATEFGFTEIERAKNGFLYLARNSSGNYDFSGAGTIYSLDIFGSWAATSFTVQASDNTSYSALCDKYYIQTQIDGEDYDAGYYTAPAVVTGNTMLNGILGSAAPSTADTIYRCSSEPLLLKANISGLMKEYEIKVDAGPDGSGTYISTSSIQTSSAKTIEFPMETLVPPSFINTDWKVAITPKGACNTTGITEVVYFKVRPVNILADYYAYRAAGSGITDNKKPLEKVLPITSSMPTGTSLTNFKLAVHNAKGWAGATSVGITAVNTNDDYILRVYEVDGTTGIRKVSAPDIAYASGPACTNCSFNFGEVSKKFDASLAPFYLDELSDPGQYYFRDYYEWAKLQGGTELANFSAKTWCSELSVIHDGCTVVNKSFFRIASTPLSGGQNAKPTGINEDNNETTILNIYPNPASTTITVMIPGADKATLLLMDNTGRRVLESNNLKSGNNDISIQRLPSGIYFYVISVDGKSQHGKLIKQ